MAAAFDASAKANGASVSSLTWAHTCSGTNRVLYVFIQYNGGGAQPTVSGVTYNGVAMTKIGTVTNSNIGLLEVWRLFAPATGSNNVIVTFTSAIDSNGATAISSSWTNASQSTDPTLSTDTEYGAGNSSPVTMRWPALTTSSGDPVVGAIGWFPSWSGGANSMVSGQTEEQQDTTQKEMLLVQHTFASGASTQLTATNNTGAGNFGDDNSMVVFIVPALAAPVGNSIATPYKVLGLTGLSRSLLFVVNSPTGGSRSLPFKVSVVLGASRALPYGIRTLAGLSRLLLYKVAALAGASRALPYSIIAASGVSRALPYAVLRTVGLSNAMSYKLVWLAGSSRSLPYTIIQPIGRSSAMAYTMAGPITKQLILPYVLTSPSGTSRALPYSVLRVVGASSARPFVVLRLVGNSRLMPYTLTGATGRSVVFLYGQTGASGQSLVLSYYIITPQYPIPPAPPYVDPTVGRKQYRLVTRSREHRDAPAGYWSARR